MILTSIIFNTYIFSSLDFSAFRRFHLISIIFVFIFICTFYYILKFHFYLCAILIFHFYDSSQGQDSNPAKGSIYYLLPNNYNYTESALIV